MSRLIYTMGPSGAGKDSLLAWLKENLPEQAPVHWARRTITRPVQAHGEQHESVDCAEFLYLLKHHAFALHWQANGLHYGVRHSELEPLEKGLWVLVNGSRAYLPHALERRPGMTVLHITASADILRQRLLARGRETPQEIEARVLRNEALLAQPTHIEIHNDESIAQAGAQLLHQLQRLQGWPLRSKAGAKVTGFFPVCVRQP